MIQDNFLYQLVDEPTREKNILDLVLTTNADLINNLKVGEPFSDHNLISFRVDTRPYQNRVSKKEVYAFNKAGWNHLRALFNKSPWYCVLEDKDININWETWKDLYFAAVKESIPKFLQKRKINAPWITKELIKLCRKKKNLYKKAKKSINEELWTAYRNLNISLKKKCNSAKWNHLKDLANKLKFEKNAKPFWSYINSKRKSTNELVLLKEGNQEETCDHDIAQQINGYFSFVFTRERDILPEFDYVVSEKLCNVLWKVI